MTTTAPVPAATLAEEPAAEPVRSPAEAAELLARARAWMRQDPDPATRDELAGLITPAARGEEPALAALADRFRGRLAFGTAGLRGALGAGPRRMNRVVVAQAAAGLAAFLRERGGSGQAPSVVIGYDGRRDSRRFALDSAEVLAGAGLRAVLLPGPLPTPVLAFAVRHLDAAAGVMVTASHNPPGDNGYKVFLGGADEGAQIVPPADGEIAERIARIEDVRALPRSEEYAVAGDDVVEAYVRATAAVAPAPAGAEGMRWAYTALHGVGAGVFARVVAAAGYPAPAAVAAQNEPDPAFPTVAFPNPEEPGALDLAFAEARRSGAEFLLAHDPDADRLAVAVPDPLVAGGWRRLTGNEVGLLLADRAARAAAGTPGAALACSLVSSPGLAAVAAHHGLAHVETLTGFKWIVRAPGFVYGYEEALGYLVNPDTVRDKDGLSAGIALLGLAAEARARDARLIELLAELERTYGCFASGQVSIRVTDVAVIAALMASLRATPPGAIGDTAVVRADDLRAGGGTLPPSDLLRYALADGSRVIVRPSGTEPKLKVYLDAHADAGPAARTRIAALDAAVRALLAARA